MTSATDELRRLLDERGVEYATDDNAASKDTMWTTQNGGWMFDCDYMEPLNEKPGTVGAKTELMIYGYMPEQAIAATLGSGTCEKVYAVGGIIAQAECRDMCSDVEQFTCSACGFNCDLTSWITPIGCDRPIVHHHHGTPNYCPNCGCKVVDE